MLDRHAFLSRLREGSGRRSLVPAARRRVIGALPVHEAQHAIGRDIGQEGRVEHSSGRRGGRSTGQLGQVGAGLGRGQQHDDPGPRYRRGHGHAERRAQAAKLPIIPQRPDRPARRDAAGETAGPQVRRSLLDHHGQVGTDRHADGVPSGVEPDLVGQPLPLAVGVDEHHAAGALDDVVERPFRRPVAGVAQGHADDGRRHRTRRRRRGPGHRHARLHDDSCQRRRRRERRDRQTYPQRHLAFSTRTFLGRAPTDCHPRQ